MNIYSDIHAAYLGVLADVWDNPDFICSPRGLEIREKVDYQFKILNPESMPIATMDEERNLVIADYTQKEQDLYYSGSNRVEDFAKISKFWNKLATVDGLIHSAYGYLIFKNKSHGSVYELARKNEDGCITWPNWNEVTAPDKDGYPTCPTMRTPWEVCVEALKADKDTRQAILRFSLPSHFYKGNRDVVCTMHGNFLIRNNALQLSIVMRSNDLVKGLCYDAPFFISLMDKMIEDLKEIYPDLTKSSYTHTVHSLHCYKRDELIILKMLGRECPM